MTTVDINIERFGKAGDQRTVNGIVYTVTEYNPGNSRFCWDGGPLGGKVYINWLNRTAKLVDADHPWRGYVGGGSMPTGFSTFERAAERLQRWKLHEYDCAKKLVAEYEAADLALLDRKVAALREVTEQQKII